MPSNLIVGGGKVFSGGALLFETAPSIWIQTVIRKVSNYEDADLDTLFGKRFFDPWIFGQDDESYIHRNTYQRENILDLYGDVLTRARNINHYNPRDPIKYRAENIDLVRRKGELVATLDGVRLDPSIPAHRPRLENSRFFHFHHFLELVLEFATLLLAELATRREETPPTSHNIMEVGLTDRFGNPRSAEEIQQDRTDLGSRRPPIIGSPDPF